MGILDGNELRFVIRCSGSVIPKGLIWAVPSAVFATVLHRFLESIGVKDNIVEQDGQIWTTFYYVLGVLLVFRTNQAYSRYWEGATLLQQVRGEWFNAASSLFAFCSKDPKAAQEVERFQHLLVRLMSMLYCAALQKIALIPPEKFETINTVGFDPQCLAFLEQSDEQCEVLVHWIQRHIIEGYSTGLVEVPAPILSRVFQELSRGLVNAQNVRKIAEVPFPFPYTQMSIVMLLASSLLTPLLASITSNSSWEAGFLAFMPVLTFWCLNYMAAEIEQPFGEDANDLPIPEMVSTMNNSLRKLLHPYTQTLPGFNYDPHRDRSCALASWGEHSGKSWQPGIVDHHHHPADRRYAAEFSKRRRTKPTVTAATTSTPERIPSRSCTAPPDCRSPEPVVGGEPDPCRSPASALRLPDLHSPAPPDEPAEVLRISTGGAAAVGCGPSPTSRTPKSEMSTTEAAAEAARTHSENTCSPFAVVHVNSDGRRSRAWVSEAEDEEEERIFTQSRRNSQPKSSVDRPPGWLSNLVGDTRSPMADAHTSVAVSVVPSQIGGLRLGPPSPHSRRNSGSAALAGS